jgi:hypothetical protein
VGLQVLFAVRRSGGAKAMIVAPKHGTPPKTGVDKREHRKGMPVPDNLLE